LLPDKNKIIIYDVLIEGMVQPTVLADVARKRRKLARRRGRRRGRVACSRFGERVAQLISLSYNGGNKISLTARVPKPVAAHSGVHLYNLVYWDSVSQRDRARLRASPICPARVPVHAPRSRALRASPTSSCEVQAFRAQLPTTIKTPTPVAATKPKEHSDNMFKTPTPPMDMARRHARRAQPGAPSELTLARTTRPLRTHLNLHSRIRRCPLASREPLRTPASSARWRKRFTTAATRMASPRASSRRFWATGMRCWHRPRRLPPARHPPLGTRRQPPPARRHQWTQARQSARPTPCG
jgi:hypothetical protein